MLVPRQFVNTHLASLKLDKNCNYICYTLISVSKVKVAAEP